uniref:CSON004103 protein n=1 Tax=Culicoides sonorensis TaxID=179676 RepID=A0A336L796_CULSO
MSSTITPELVKLNILNPGFIQPQSYTLSPLENVELCYICSSEKGNELNEIQSDIDEIALIKTINEILKINLPADTKIHEKLCKSCKSHLKEYQDFLFRLNTLKAVLQVAYKKGQEILAQKSLETPEITLFKNTDLTGTTTYLIYQSKESKEDDAAPHLFITHDSENIVEVIDDQQENFEGYVQLTAISDFESPLLYERKNPEQYECKQCLVEENNQILYDLQSIQSHLLSDHGYSVYICENCDSYFTDDRELDQHKNEFHSLTSQLVIRCTKCDKTFTTRKCLEEHAHLHAEDPRPFKCPKEGCNKDFTSKYTLTSHMKIHTNRPRPFRCKICDKSFYHAQNLMQHEKLHTSTKEFFCPLCNKAFSTQHNLDVHLIVHSKVKKFTCGVCKKQFARKAEIRDHERTHTGERPFACDLCSATFAQRSNLLSHKKATHLNDKRHKCTYCDRGFKRRRLLDYHVKSAHTGERPYACQICTATFVIPEHYKKHLQIHTGKKAFTCELCKRSFSSKDNLKAHRFVHSKQKPYECVVCQMGFMRKNLLFSHMKKALHDTDQYVVNEPKIGSGNSIEIAKTFVTIEENSHESAN